LALTSAALAVARASPCLHGECADEETSLLSLRQARVNNTGTQCINRRLQPFPCGAGECCGDICMAAGGTCCTNSLGNNFACAAGDSCCGNACASAASQCCTGPSGYKYPAVTCPSQATRCVNNEGTEFFCGADSTCCGGACVGKGGVCCTNPNTGAGFPCGEGSSCCGGGCAAPGSKCCSNNGVEFPVTADTLCPGESTGIQCINRFGNVFACGAQSSCCGDICVGKGGQCCTNNNGNNFACGPRSRCSGNICAPA